MQRCQLAANGVVGLHSMDEVLCLRLPCCFLRNAFRVIITFPVLVALLLVNFYLCQCQSFIYSLCSLYG